MISQYQKGLVSIAMFLVVVMARVFFLTQPLVGEEGTFAMLVTGTNSNTVSLIDSPRTELSKHCQLYVAKLNGVDYVGTPDRNVVPYCFLTQLVNPITKGFSKSDATFEQKTFHVRLIFFIIASTGFLALFLMIFFIKTDTSISSYVALNLIAVYFLTTPLLIGGSIQANLEGSIGVALFGLSALSSYVGTYKLIKNGGIFIFSAGFLISLGKNEWPLVALVCSLTYLLMHIIIYRKGSITYSKKNQIVVTLNYIFGLSAGILFCYFLSPKDYLDGFSLMMGGVNATNLRIFDLIRVTGHLLYPTAMLVALVIVMYLFNFKKYFVTGAIPFLWASVGVGTFVGFLYSGWIGDGFPRYFIPSMIFLLPFLIVSLPNLPKKLNVFLIIILICGVGVNTLSLVESYRRNESITSVPGLDTAKLKSDSISLIQKNAADRNLIPFDHFGTRYYFPDADVISIGMGLNGAEFIIRKFGHQGMTIIQAPD
jgi:hypothetical protein